MMQRPSGPRRWVYKHPASDTYADLRQTRTQDQRGRPNTGCADRRRYSEWRVRSPGTLAGLPFCMGDRGVTVSPRWAQIWVIRVRPWARLCPRAIIMMAISGFAGARLHRASPGRPAITSGPLRSGQATGQVAVCAGREDPAPGTMLVIGG
jgi:hypothetical protein